MCSAVMWDTVNAQATSRLVHISPKGNLNYTPSFFRKYASSSLELAFPLSLVYGFISSSTETFMTDNKSKPNLKN
jgi:hypothetical protein